MVTREGVHIGVGCVNVALLHREHDLLGLAADGVFNDLDETAEFDGTVVADIVDAVEACCGNLWIVERDRDHAGHDVGNPGEVALHLAVIEDVDRAALDHIAGESPVGHVGPAPRAIDREEAQADLLHLVEPRVGFAHQFA